MASLSPSPPPTPASTIALSCPAPYGHPCLDPLFVAPPSTYIPLPRHPGRLLTILASSDHL